MELHNRGHLLMVNEPLYKSKMIQIMETAIKEKVISLRHGILGGDTHEFLEIDNVHSDPESSNDSDKSELNSSSTGIVQVEEARRTLSSSRYGIVNNCFLELTEACSERNNWRQMKHSQWPLTVVILNRNEFNMQRRVLMDKSPLKAYAFC
ncbi:hypothetical protein R6Q59_008090 [Mikania micrantha]